MGTGTISQWGEVSKAKKTSRPKAKEAPAASNESSNVSNTRASRGARAVSEGGRGGRGRATERGGRGGRGRSTQPATNGTRQKENQQLSVPTEESTAWGTETAKTDVVEEREPLVEKPLQVGAAPSAAPQAKTWASMLRQSTVPKAAPKPKEAPALETAEPVQPATAVEPAEPEPAPTHEPEEESTPVVEQATTAPVAIIEPEVALSPSHDELTKTNLEQVADVSKPPATHTAASTTADSWDPRQNPVSATATPLSAAQQQHQAQRATSGFAASAIKAAAERTVRTPTYQRRVLDQEEAVRMPGNREVDRAAVQFGAFNLGGGDEDIDGDREEPETRTQPPADSPVSHPRASLPPVAQPTAVHEQKAASGLPSTTGMFSSFQFRIFLSELG